MELSTIEQVNRLAPADVPQGRLDTGMGMLDLEIVSLTSTLKFDPNGLVMAAYTDKLFEGEPAFPSFLSGRPGYLYRNEDLQIAFTANELQRFVRHNLRPDEFFKLYRALGSFFEIHDDFYDVDTGLALQPRD